MPKCGFHVRVLIHHCQSDMWQNFRKGRNFKKKITLWLLEQQALYDKPSLNKCLTVVECEERGRRVGDEVAGVVPLYRRTWSWSQCRDATSPPPSSHLNSDGNKFKGLVSKQAFLHVLLKKSWQLGIQIWKGILWWWCDFTYLSVAVVFSAARINGLDQRPGIDRKKERKKEIWLFVFMWPINYL